jgi:integrase
VKFIRFRAIAKYKVDNPDYLPRPEEGADTRKANQKRREVWKQASTFLEVKKGRTRKQTESSMSVALEDWRKNLNAEAQKEAERASLASAKMTVAEYVKDYVDTLEASGAVRPSAISDYRTTSRRIAEGSLGSIIMADLRTQDIEKWEASLLKSGRGVNTVLKYHRLLNSVCRRAVAVHDLTWNPCMEAKKPKRVQPKPNSLNEQQHSQVAATLYAMRPTPLVTAASIALYTGMREGEICGLRWKCVDFRAGVISVESAIAKAGGKLYESDPKTEASRRRIPIHPNLAHTLEARLELMKAELSETGVTLDAQEFGELFVCGQIDGRFFSNNAFTRSWREMADGLGLVGTQGRRITVHDLRHSFATRAITAGADVKAVAAVLGHTNATVTINIYADSTEQSKLNAVTRAGNALAGEAEPLAALATSEED